MVLLRGPSNLLAKYLPQTHANLLDMEIVGNCGRSIRFNGAFLASIFPADSRVLIRKVIFVNVDFNPIMNLFNLIVMGQAVPFSVDELLENYSLLEIFKLPVYIQDCTVITHVVEVPPLALEPLATRDVLLSVALPVLARWDCLYCDKSFTCESKLKSHLSLSHLRNQIMKEFEDSFRDKMVSFNILINDLYLSFLFFSVSCVALCCSTSNRCSRT